MSKGMLHVCFGDGPGKTTAAAGLAVRARGCGLTVLFAQFLKNGRSGELASLKLLGVDILDSKPIEKFFVYMNEREKAQAIEEQRNAFQDMVGKVHAGRYDLLILDEILDVVKLGMISPEELLGFLRGRSENLEVVATGHEVFPELIELADYMTEVKKVKHPFDRGIAARRGVEW